MSAMSGAVVSVHANTTHKNTSAMDQGINAASRAALKSRVINHQTPAKKTEAQPIPMIHHFHCGLHLGPSFS